MPDNRPEVESGARQGIVELLGRVPLFSELSPDELDQVAQVAIPRTFPGDTRVFHEGDAGDACYIVSAGSCRVTRQHSDGRTITLATLGPGTIFGELAMFDGERRSASVEAAENTELLALPASDMRTLIRDHSEIVDATDRRNISAAVGQFAGVYRETGLPDWLSRSLAFAPTPAGERLESHAESENEEANIPAIFPRLMPVLEASARPYEVILIDDGSRDRSLHGLRSQAEKYPGKVTVIEPERHDAYIF